MRLPLLRNPGNKENQHDRYSRPWDNLTPAKSPHLPHPAMSNDTHHQPFMPLSDNPRTHNAISSRMRIFEQNTTQPTRPLDVFPDIAVNTFASANVIPCTPPSPPTSINELPHQSLRTRLGNRDLKPLLASPIAPPLVGLPIPQAEPHPVRNTTVDPPPHLDDPTYQHISPQQEQQPEPRLHTRVQTMTMEDPDLRPRFSYRNSMRLPPPRDDDPDTNDLQAAARTSVGSSRRISNRRKDLSFLPESSSFLDFNEDHRLVSLQDPPESTPPSIWGALTFDDPDSFDTFGTLPDEHAEPQEPSPLIRPESDESEKPAFPAVSSTRQSAVDTHQNVVTKVSEEDDGALDVPSAFTTRPGAEGALRDLQRASVTAGNELASSLRRMSMAEPLTGQAPFRKDRVSKVQGELLLRSRIFRRWNIRYASVVHQGYFGAVLLLFRPDTKGISLGHVALKNSKMIALTESAVKKVSASRKSSMFMFELKTSQRTYTFACNDEESRYFWMSSLTATR